MSKKPPPTFIVQFRGRNVYPEQVSWRKVSEALHAAQKLATIGLPENRVSDDGGLRLIGVTRGSTGLQCYAEDGDRAIANLSRTGAMLETGRLPEEDPAAHIDPIKDLSRLARTLGCEVVIRRDRGVLATISGDSYDRIAGSFMVSGETTLSGRVERVGGATRLRCVLRVPNRPELLYCDVNSVETARELGERLKEEVVVTGDAQWLKTTWAVVGLRIKSLEPTHRAPLQEAFAALRAAGGDAWDQVDDPEALLGQIRG